MRSIDLTAPGARAGRATPPVTHAKPAKKDAGTVPMPPIVWGGEHAVGAFPFALAGGSRPAEAERAALEKIDREKRVAV